MNMAEIAGRLSADSASWTSQACALAEDRFGEHGKNWASQVSDHDFIKLWADPAFSPPGSRLAFSLAIVIWRERTKAQIERERKNLPVGYAGPVARLLTDVTKRGNIVRQDDSRQIDFLLDRDDTPIAIIENGTLATGVTLASLEQLQSEAALLSSIEACALIHYLAREARKAQRELGWTYRPAQEVLLDIVDQELKLLANRQKRDLVSRLTPVETSE